MSCINMMCTIKSKQQMQGVWPLNTQDRATSTLTLLKILLNKLQDSLLHLSNPRSSVQWLYTYVLLLFLVCQTQHN